MTQRFLQALLALFPASYRATSQGEMSDALKQSNPRGVSAVREGTGLLGAAGRAWHTYLGRPEALKTSLFFGFLMWFALLAGIGPLSRAVWSVQDKLPAGLDHGPTYRFLIAAAILLAAVIALFVSRLTAGLLFVGALGAVAWSTTLPTWSPLARVVYEIRWLAVPFCLALLLRPDKGMAWHVKAALSVMILGLVANLSSGSNLGGYANSFRSIRHNFGGSLPDGNVSVFLAAVAFLVVALLPWFLPAVASALLGPLVTASVVAPYPIFIVGAIYLIGVAWVRQARLSEPPALIRQ